jgi:AcrR family transcriptional regulator
MSEDRRKEILAAAGRCFATYGYEKATLEDIASQVGINKVSLYHYFKNKEAIFAEIIAAEAEQYSKALNAKVDAASDCRQKILTWIREGLRYNESSSILHQFSLESLSRLAPQLEDLKRSTARKGAAFLAAVLEEGQRTGEVDPCDTGKVAQAIHGIVYAMKDAAYHRARLDMKHAVDPGRLTQEILFAVSLVLDGIMAKKSKGK